MAAEPWYEYVLYVDEAGDAGIRTVAQGNKGSTDWFAMGGFVTSRDNEPKIVDWVRDVRHAAGASDGLELHYNTLDADRRVEAAAAVASLPIRAFTVMSHKDNMRGHHNKRAASSGSKNYYYNFCLRILLERATQAVADYGLRKFGEVKPMKIVVAMTGGVRYDLTVKDMDKLRAQAITGTTFLNAAVIHPTVAASWLFEHVNAKNTAGCQIADVIVSSFYNAVNERGSCPLYAGPAKSMAKIMGRRNNTVANCGLKLLPWDAKIPEQHREIFAHYGYKW